MKLEQDSVVGAGEKVLPTTLQLVVAEARGIRRLADLEVLAIALELLDDAGRALAAVREMAAEMPAEDVEHLRRRLREITAAIPAPPRAKRNARCVFFDTRSKASS